MVRCNDSPIELSCADLDTRRFLRPHVHIHDVDRLVKQAEEAAKLRNA